MTTATRANEMTEPLQTRIGKFCTDRLYEFKTFPYPRCLYHYTSAAGMLGILESGKLRAHNIDHLNDKAEIRYAVSVMRAHVERARAVEPIEAVAELLAQIAKQLDSIDTSHVFIASFSAENDDRSLWRLYSDREKGFSFCIPTYKIEDWGGFLMKCQYDPAVLDRFCTGALETVRTCFIDDLRQGQAPDLERYAAEFLYDISYFAPMFKPHVWSDEKEWRILFLRPPAERKKLPDGRSYIELPPKDRMPIVALCAGGQCEQQSVTPLQLYMHKNNMDIPIHVADGNKTLQRASPHKDRE
jgi:hypothetical protein